MPLNIFKNKQKKREALERLIDEKIKESEHKQENKILKLESELSKLKLLIENTYSNVNKSNQYYIVEFMSSCITRTDVDDDHITKQEVMNEFNKWINEIYGNIISKQLINDDELYDSMIIKYGICHNINGWSGIHLNYDVINDINLNQISDY